MFLFSRKHKAGNGGLALCDAPDAPLFCFSPKSLKFRFDCRMRLKKISVQIYKTHIKEPLFGRTKTSEEASRRNDRLVAQRGNCSREAPSVRLHNAFILLRSQIETLDVFFSFSERRIVRAITPVSYPLSMQHEYKQSPPARHNVRYYKQSSLYNRGVIEVSAAALPIVVLCQKRYLTPL